MTNRIYQDTTIFGELDIAGGGTVGPNLLAAIRDAILPVGTIVTGVATSPAATIGGTWEQIKDVFILAASSAYPAGSVAGEANHTLTINEMPSHKHEFPYANNILGIDATQPEVNALTMENGNAWNNLRASGNIMTNTGGSQPHNNMPPYQAEYTWKRVA